MKIVEKVSFLSYRLQDFKPRIRDEKGIKIII